MTEYTPTTEDVRFDYATTTKADSHGGEARARAFNRWLARVQAEAQVKAIEELAQAWQLNGWAQDIPRYPERHQLIIGMAQRATDFIREYKDHIAREAGIEQEDGDNE